MLQHTITSLKELASMYKRLTEEFKTESGGVVRDIKTQMDGFEGFERQQKRIEGLQGRVTESRGKIKMLGGRVDVVRKRVEGWEKVESEWQEKTRKRLRILWILMTVCGAAVLALVVFQYTPGGTPGVDVDAIQGLNASGLGGGTADMGNIKNKPLGLKGAVAEALENTGQRDEEEKPLDDDPRLRLFDEL